MSQDQLATFEKKSNVYLCLAIISAFSYVASNVMNSKLLELVSGITLLISIRNSAINESQAIYLQETKGGHGPLAIPQKGISNGAF